MIFDTDVIIWAIRGSTEAAKAIEGAGTRYISAITYMELIRGAGNKEDPRLIKTFLNNIGAGIIPLDSDISHRACIYVAEYSLKTGMGAADALIAATAAENGMRLCTGNYKDFREIKGIEVKVFKLQ
jgi:predicted nucleic acid-binding protein